MVLLKRLNLNREEYPFQGKFDLILCRNVMIYFDQEMRRKLVNNLCRYLNIGGFLFVGHSESLGRDWAALKYIQPAVYQYTGS